MMNGFPRHTNALHRVDDDPAVRAAAIAAEAVRDTNATTRYVAELAAATDRDTNATSREVARINSATEIYKAQSSVWAALLLAIGAFLAFAVTRF